MTVFDLDVSRETLERLHILESLVTKWNPSINLVSKGSIQELWTRHIIDSAQVFQCVTAAGHWLDIGSGGGFPGLVVAALATDAVPDLRVTLVESDRRKGTFLRTATREMGLSCQILTERIESLDPQNATVLSARALTELAGLLGYCERHLVDGGVGVFPKGVSWRSEVENAQKGWKFSSEAVKSKTDSASVILKIKGISRV